jgi:hypothetical protein
MQTTEVTQGQRKAVMVSGKKNGRYWRYHLPDTLPQRMNSLSLLACSYHFTAEMYLDFSKSFNS